VSTTVCCVSSLNVDGRVHRCRDDDDDDDEDCDSSGDYQLPHNDAGVHRSTSTWPFSVQPSNGTAAADHKPSTTTSATQLSPEPRGVASKRSGTDSDESGDPVDTPDDSVPSTTTSSQLAVHIMLIGGSSVGVVVVLLLAALAVYKYRSRDQGSYRLDPDAPNGYVPAPGTERYRLRRTSSSGLASSGPSDQNCSTIYRLRNSRSKSKGRRDVKEWYV